MRRAPALLCLALLLAGCSGTGSPAGTSGPVASSPVAPSGTTSSPVAPPTASPSAPAELQLPSDAPTSFDQPLEPGLVPTDALIPPEAQVTASWSMAPPADPLALLGLAWARGADPFAQQRGFVIWERFDGQDPPWRAVYAFTDRPARGIFGIRLTPGDLTQDGIADVLTFEDAGGSGACGMWRVISPTAGAAEQIFHEPTCDTEIVSSGGTLRIREAVYQPGDAHCCPSSYLITTLRWNGTSWRPIETARASGASGDG